MNKANMGHNRKKTKGTPDSADIYAGMVLRTLRKLKGVSQIDLADKINVTFQQVQKYEKGKNRMSVGRVNDISFALDVSPAIFFFDEQFPKSFNEKEINEYIRNRRKDKNILCLSKNETDLIRVMSQVSESKQSEFASMVKKFGKMFAESAS